MAGKGNKRRVALRKAQALGQTSRAAAKNPLVKVPLPLISENDLLAFQTAHFGDDAMPESWVIDAKTALDYNPADEDDGLGYYADGAKRTLTDEQIAMFRHSEIETLVREGKMVRPEVKEPHVDVTDNAITASQPANSPAPKASNLMDETTKNATSPDDTDPTSKNRVGSPSEQSKDSTEAVKWSSQGNRSSCNASTSSSKRKRKEDVPYHERNKRKWEHHIEDHDPEEGSMTHRRIVRELDEIQDESVDLEY